MSVSVLAALLLWLCSSASCAPAAGVGLQDACAEVRGTSQELNRLAKTFSVARNEPKEQIEFYISPWMEAKDMCDPESLKHTPAPCLGKTLSVLTSYTAAVKTVAGIQSCEEFANKVTPAMETLHKHLSKCVKSKKGTDQVKGFHIDNEDTQPVPQWQEKLLCNYTKERLFSFSILTARIFAVGDPAHHIEGSSQTCNV